MTRIVKVRNMLSPRTPRNVAASSANAGTKRWAGSFHDPAEKTRRTTAKRGIRRLMVSNPMNNPNERNLNEFTNNPNPKFDPSKAPGSVSRTTSVKRMSVGSVGRGHAKVFKPNRQTLFGGKTLRRKQF